MLPKTRIRKELMYGIWWWLVMGCRCYGRAPHSHRRRSAESAWECIAHARDWYDRRHPNPSPAGITNDEAVRLHGRPATESIN